MTITSDVIMAIKAKVKSTYKEHPTSAKEHYISVRLSEKTYDRDMNPGGLSRYTLAIDCEIVGAYNTDDSIKDQEAIIESCVKVLEYDGTNPLTDKCINCMVEGISWQYDEDAELDILTSTISLAVDVQE